jgi:adenine-specific DNA-methyltransferase
MEKHLETITDFYNRKDFINFSIWIDKYLIPQDIEKKQNAEVSTPYILRIEMISKIPNEFWKSVRKVFEPCAGKGGFEAIVGNPPYQESNDDGRKALNNNLWSDFINYSFNILNKNGYLLFITPNSWMSPTSKNNSVFYNNYIIYLNISECEKWFDVGSKFSYYLIQKTPVKKETEIKCLYKKKVYDSKILIDGYTFLPMLLCDKSLSIIKKFYSNDLPKVSFKSSCELHNTTKKNNIKDNMDNIYKYPIRHTAKRNIRYSNIKHSLTDKNKILMNISGNLVPIYDNGTIGFTQAQMYLLIDNNKYINVLNSNVYKMIFEISKWSGFNIEKIYHNIPYIEEEKDIYKLLQLSKEEIEFVENY